MVFDFQPSLDGDLVKLRPLRHDDFAELFAVAQDPLIWEQHPVKDRYQKRSFRVFFQEAITTEGTLVARDAGTQKVIGSLVQRGFITTIVNAERSRLGGRSFRASVGADGTMVK